MPPSPSIREIRTLEDLKPYLYARRPSSLELDELTALVVETERARRALGQFTYGTPSSLFATGPFVASLDLLRIALSDDNLGLVEHSIHALDNPHLAPEGAQVLFDTWCTNILLGNAQEEELHLYTQALARARQLGARWTPSMETVLSIMEPSGATATCIELADISVPASHIRYYSTHGTSWSQLSRHAQIAHRLEHADWLNIFRPLLATTLLDRSLVGAILTNRSPGCLSDMLSDLPRNPILLAQVVDVFTSADWDALLPTVPAIILIDTLERMKPEQRALVPYQSLVNILSGEPSIRPRALAILNDWNPNKAQTTRPASMPRF